MPPPTEYEDANAAVGIAFRIDDLDLREIGVLAQGLHRAFNTSFISLLAPEVTDIVRLAARIRVDDPLFLSLRVDDLRQGSLLATCSLRISPRLRRDLAVGTAASLIAATIWAIGEAAYPRAHHEPPPQVREVQRTPDVGPGVRTMVKRLSETGKPWEITLIDTQSGYEVTIRSR